MREVGAESALSFKAVLQPLHELIQPPADGLELSWHAVFLEAGRKRMGIDFGSFSSQFVEGEKTTAQDQCK